MKIYFYTLGCKVNQYETEAMAELFAKAGYVAASEPANADVIVINSCTVTANSDQKTRQAVRRFKRNNPDACVVLTGCMPQAFPDDVKKLTEADIITGNTNRNRILELVENYFSKLPNDIPESDTSNEQLFSIDSHDADEAFENISIDKFAGRTRAFIKIQDGCNRYCSYCIIPTARGRSRSRSMESLNVELDKIKNAGFKEVVLVGINFCCYGIDIGKTFTDAIELACNKGFKRVRIGSLEFDNISDDAIERLSKHSNFCPQFHISLQSGNDATLKRMNRHYTTEEYAELCTKLRKKFRNATITTDLMVGFPLESEDEFEESMAFVRKCGFEKIHVFPYSPRAGTKAAEMPQVDSAEKNRRTQIALSLSAELRENFLKSQIGKTVNVLAETYNTETDLLFGYTRNYTPVSFKISSDAYTSIVSALSNKVLSVKITGIDIENDCCIGEML